MCATKLLALCISKLYLTPREPHQSSLPWQRWHLYLWRSVDELPPLCQAQLACCHHEAYYWFWWHPHNVTSERSLTKLHRWQIADSPSYCYAQLTILHLAEEGVQLVVGVATIKHWHFLGSSCGALQEKTTSLCTVSKPLLMRSTSLSKYILYVSILQMLQRVA